MFMSIRRGCAAVLCFFVCMASVTGCLFGKSPLSSDNVMKCCAEYDSEEYKSLEDMKADVENDRALLAGMYIKLEGESIKKTLTNDKVGDVLADAQEELLKNLYSKMIKEATVLIQAENSSDGGVNKMAAVAMDFEDDSDAGKYYKALVRFLSQKYEETSKDDDDTYSIYTVKELKGKRAFCERVYMKGKNVFVIAGYEYRNNSVTDKLRSFCDIVGVEAPDISYYDCNSKDNADRFAELVSATGASEMNKREFEKKSSDGSSMCNYAELSSPEVFINEMTGFAMEDKTYRSCRCLINHQSRNDIMTGYYIFEIKVDSVPNAVYLFDSLCGYMKSEHPDSVKTVQDNKDGVRYLYVEVSDSLSSKIYAAYSENDTVYIFGAYAQDSLNSSGYYYEVINAMELPAA